MVTTEPIIWTTSDLDRFSDQTNRYEIIEGELFVTRASHWRHQNLCGRIFSVLETWSKATGLGQTAVGPGLIFSETNNVIPDVVWVSQEQLETILDESGHLIAAPDLVIEILSKSLSDRQRDRITKLKLYGSQGVREYWIFDPEAKQVEIHRRDQFGNLKLVATLFANDRLTSPLLPEFDCTIAPLFE